AGAGPPANRIAARRIARGACCAFEEMDSSELMRCSNSGFFKPNQFILTLTAIDHGDNGTALRRQLGLGFQSWRLLWLVLFQERLGRRVAGGRRAQKES